MRHRIAVVLKWLVVAHFFYVASVNHFNERPTPLPDSNTSVPSGRIRVIRQPQLRLVRDADYKPPSKGIWDQDPDLAKAYRKTDSLHLELMLENMRREAQGYSQ